MLWYLELDLKNNVFRCDGFIPAVIPDYVKEVELVDLKQNDLFDGAFCDSGWNSVTNLSIVCKQKCETEFHTIGDNVFRCLDNLERLSIHLHVLEFVGNYTLAGLSKLSVLDLSKCYMLSSMGVARLLSDESGLSAIPEIILSETGLYCRPNYFELNEALIDQLGKRRVSSLNLSSGRTYVKEFGMASFERFCSSIVTLNMSDSVVVRSHVFEHQKPCSSLRVLDVSGVNPTRINSLFPDKVLSINDTVVVIGEQLYPMLLRRVSSLFLNNVISKEHILYLRNASITLTAHNNLKELYVCGYNMPVFDLKVFLTYQYLEKFVLSDNSIETLSADVFKNFTLLRQIDISNNRLGHSKLINTTFSNLFRTNNVISIILMAGNGIHNLPNHTFMFNTLLETIDISENAFQQITFGIDHLRHLNVLDMRNNAIQYLNEFSRNSLDMLYNHQNERAEEARYQLFVDLRGNPFTCSCDSLDFLMWFALSPIFKSTRYQYSCKIGGQTFPMTSAAISAAIDDCEKPVKRRRKLVLATVLPILAATAILASVIAIIKLLRKKIRQDRIQLIQNGDKFLTFLSFSDEDKQFVAANILQPLKVATLLQSCYALTKLGSGHCLIVTFEALCRRLCLLKTYV